MFKPNYFVANLETGFGWFPQSYDLLQYIPENKKRYL